VGDNIPMDFQGRGWKDVNWIRPAESGDDDSSDSLKCGYFLTGRGTDTFSKKDCCVDAVFVADAWETQHGAAICAWHIYSHTTLVWRRVEVWIKMLSLPNLWKIRERRRSYKFPKPFDRHNRPVSGDGDSKYSITWQNRWN
jgi:hypothetical protein